MQNEADAYRNVQLRVEDVQGRYCLTQFYVSGCTTKRKAPATAHGSWQDTTPLLPDIIPLLPSLLSPFLGHWTGHIPLTHPIPLKPRQGMDLTTDKLRSLVRKWQTLIEAHVDVKTTDGYYLRLFCISFTKKRPGQVKKTAYAQSSQIRMIRKKMVEIMTREATSCDLKELVGKFIPEAIGELSWGGCACTRGGGGGHGGRTAGLSDWGGWECWSVLLVPLSSHAAAVPPPRPPLPTHPPAGPAGKEIEKSCQGIYPLQNTFVRKVKLLRAPKFDVGKLMEVHGDYTAEVGEKIERAEGEAEPTEVVGMVTEGTPAY